MHYVFGRYSLDTERCELCQEAQGLPLEPKVYQVLVYLVQQRHRMVSKDELLEQVWPGVYVDDRSVARCIVTLRKALGDSPGLQRVIQTRRGHGYRFVAAVTEHTVAPPRATPPGAPAPTAAVLSPAPRPSVPWPGGGERKLVTVLCGTFPLPDDLVTSLDLDSLDARYEATAAFVQRVVQPYGGPPTRGERAGNRAVWRPPGTRRARPAGRAGGTGAAPAVAG
jgi:DNA-binding winged helix-turn-helix (wHTH) protein